MRQTTQDYISCFLCRCLDAKVNVAQAFDDRWQLPHCVGAIDGKHVEIIKPPHSGSAYINYKGYFSVVLLAVVDADYKLLYVDVGAEGRFSDGGVFAHSSLSLALENNSLNLPDACQLSSESDKKLPFYIVGDDAFPLKTYLMKPYSKRDLTPDERIANYRFSRARRVMENTFGIMANVFRVLHTPMLVAPMKAEKIILAICVLHIFLRSRARSTYLSPFVEVQDPGYHHLTDLNSTRHKNATNAAKDVRDELKNYFTGAGRVPRHITC